MVIKIIRRRLKMKKKKISFKDYLEDYFEYYNITKEEFASSIGITTNDLNDILSGELGLSDEIIERISIVTNISKDYIYKMEADSF